MSRDGFELRVEEDMTPQALIELFVKAADHPESGPIEVEADNNEPQAYATCVLDIVDLFARHMLNSPARHLGKDHFGFSTSVFVNFSSMLWDKLPYEAAKETTENYLLKTTLRLLETHPMNLALTISVNAGIVALRYFDAQLFLNTHYPTWTPERLAWVTMPYITEDMP